MDDRPADLGDRAPLPPLFGQPGETCLSQALHHNGRHPGLVFERPSEADSIGGAMTWKTFLADDNRNNAVLLLPRGAFPLIGARALMAAHRQGGRPITVWTWRPSEGPQYREEVVIDRDGLVQAVRRRYPRGANHSRVAARLAGVMIGRGLAEAMIRAGATTPAQLLKAAQQAGPTRRAPAEPYFSDLNRPDSYLQLHEQWMLRRPALVSRLVGREPVAPGIWVGPNAEHARGAALYGPVVLGAGARVQDGCRLIGPVVIGPGVTVPARTRVARSIVCTGADLEHQNNIESVVAVPGMQAQLDEVLLPQAATPSGNNGHTSPGNDRPPAVSSAEPKPWTVVLDAQPVWMTHVRHRLHRALKRVVDLLGAVVGLALTLPFYPLIALAIKLESRGPLFFGHWREGRRGHPFRCLKFRTMVSDADIRQNHLRRQSANEVDGPQFYIKDDPRLTRVGRLLRKINIDEWPQFLNVLVGQMSLVGPRPSPFAENQYCPAWREARLSVKPGITGLWQVSRDTDRQAGGFHEWIQYDLKYVRNQSLLGDLSILIRTGWMVFDAMIVARVKKRFGLGRTAVPAVERAVR